MHSQANLIKNKLNTRIRAVLDHSDIAKKVNYATNSKLRKDKQLSFIQTFTVGFGISPNLLDLNTH